MNEGLDHLLTRHHLFDKAVFNPQVLLLISEIATRFARDIFDNIGHDSNHQKNEKEKERADHDHADCYPDNGDGRLQELWDRLLDRLAKSIDVIGVDRHDIPVLVGIEVLDRELLHAGKELVP